MEIKEAGQVKAVCKNIARVAGFHSCLNGQVVSFESGVPGMIMGFTKTDTLTLILGNEAKVRLGDACFSRAETFKVPVGEKFLGRVVNALGEPCDDKGKIEPADYFPVMCEAPETMDREPADSFLETGTTIIDAFVPIAKGQRQMIVGDRMTGKTTIAVDAILNQKGKNVICIYCCIGKSMSSLIKVAGLLKARGALDYTLIAAAPAASPAGEQYLIPFTATALAEYFMQKGQDCLVVFDDMTKHAWCYRQLSLLLGRPPGREAYPGDIFYLHTQLLERAGKLHREHGGGSITSLLIVDTLHGDVTGFIPSNFISMTDGQIYLNADIFKGGFKPAVDIAQSVSIIGSLVQPQELKEKKSPLRLEYMRYRDLQRLTKLKVGLSAEAESRIKRGEAITALLRQDKNTPISLKRQAAFLSALMKGNLDGLSEMQIEEYKKSV
ncbi:MAG: F0F1 ATP synthase subunit alpha [Deltaproteobacteria bacterium]|nr:F0F1 ATP synthase subunit alpha [Deltaproteobacteria bacterium]